MNIFSGIKILDLSRVFSGPFATRHFADFGADVIKIEPLDGDDSRVFPPLRKNWSGYFEVLNRNKKSLFLDLKSESGLKKILELSKSADVIVENFTPGVTERLKIDYKTIKKMNSRIIYASISGISVNKKIKYYDVIAQAESGLISLNGETEDMKVATSVTDAFSGMKLAFAVSSALFLREKTGKGQKLVVSMKGSAFDLLEQNLLEASLTNKNPAKSGNMDNAIAPFGIFKTKDGSIAIAVGNEKLWKKFSGFIDKSPGYSHSKLYADNRLRLKNVLKLKKDIENVFSRFTTGTLERKLKKIGIPCGKVNKMLDVLSDRENKEEGLTEKVKIKGVGNVVVPTGGIFFGDYKKEKYKSAPGLK